MIKKIFLTGATGFIGRNLVSKLLERGFELSLCALNPEELEILGNDRSSLRTFILENRKDEFFSILNTAAPDLIIHLATHFLNSHSRDEIDPLIDTNVRLGTRVLQAAADLKIPYFMNVGTYYQNYQGEAYNPVSLYAATKQAFADILHYYTETGALRALTLKLHDTYGPRDTRKKLFALLQEAATSGKPLEMSPGEQEMNLLHVDDICSAFIHSISLLEKQSGTATAYSVGAPRLYPLREVVEIYERTMGIKIPVSWGARPYRPREVMKPRMPDPPLPGWEPRIALEAGIRKL